MDTIAISQEQIINGIVKNAELAAVSKPFHDIFVTAPTGSGKSIMFQIPAIYLAENKKLLTIVITPLIGLMNDQVKNVHSMTDCAATINSEYTPEEKNSIRRRIQNGEISILYVSPETILSNGSISNLIGDRSIGLLVVDEAHIVSTWGKSFRPDYWYLGDFISNLRTKYGYNFPIAAFSATVTYGGEDDMHADIIESLKMRTGEYEFIAPMRRDDIHFDIRLHDTPSDYKEAKDEAATKSLSGLLEGNGKTVAYFPFISQIRHYKSVLSSSKVGIYHGGSALRREEKAETASDFSAGKIKMVLATKAFGMGIDVPDIKTVYHFAPTGNLCDYVQEIGRAARETSMTGIAMTDYFDTDARYIKQLYGISSIKNYQVIETLKKIASIYRAKGKRNFSISPDDFSYIFANTDDMNAVENALKITMLIIQKDFALDPHLNFPPISFRPRSMFADTYVMVEPADLSKLKRSPFSKYFELYSTAKQMATNYVTKKDYFAKNYTTGEVHKESSSVSTSITFQGDIYIAHLREMWEENYDLLSFSQFKYKFYKGGLAEIPFSANLKSEYILTVTSNSGTFGEIKDKLGFILKDLQEVFISSDLRNSNFDASDIAKVLSDSNEFQMTPTELAIAAENLLKVLNTFGTIQFDFGTSNSVFKKNSSTGKYTLSSICNLKEKIKLINNEFDREYSGVMQASRRPFLIPISKAADSKQILIAQLLEMLHLATYETISGARPEYFIRVNSIYAINRVINNSSYQSQTVAQSWRRHEDSI